MNETSVSTKLRVALAALGAVAWKVSDRFHASRPDLFVAYQSEVFFIEMKIWPNQPTSLQRDTLNELSAVGILTYVGHYDVKLKTLSITNWVTLEKEYFYTYKEASVWLLEQHI